MKLEDCKSGEYVKMNDYKAFIPSKINYNWEWTDTKLNKLLSEADRQIGELNAYSLLIPNVDLYIKMHVKIEANKSSRIEGTRTTIDEDYVCHITLKEDYTYKELKDKLVNEFNCVVNYTLNGESVDKESTELIANGTKVRLSNLYFEKITGDTSVARQPSASFVIGQ